MWKEYRDVACHWTKEICVAKAQQELKLAKYVGVKEKKIFKYVNLKEQSKNNIGLLQNENGHPTNRDINKTEKFNAFFASIFNTDDGLRGSQCPELEDHGCETG